MESKSLEQANKNQKKELDHLRNIDKDILEKQAVALKMRKDGFTIEQVAEALGYPANSIATLLEERVELGSPEEILRECLKTVISLVPLAEAQYRAMPTVSNQSSLTSFIRSGQDLIETIYQLREKEETFRVLIQRILQPMCRQMCKHLIEESKGAMEGRYPKIKLEYLEEVVTDLSSNLATQFKEEYRKSIEELSEVLGVSNDAKARIIAGATLS